MQHADARLAVRQVALGELFCELASAVGAAVIDDLEVQAGQLECHHLLDSGLEAADLVVGRHDDGHGRLRPVVGQLDGLAGHDGSWSSLRACANAAERGTDDLGL